MTLPKINTQMHMEAIFDSLQQLLQEAAPTLRQEHPQEFAQTLELVSSGRGSLAARITTSPAAVTLTIHTADGEHSIVTFMQQVDLN